MLSTLEVEAAIYGQPRYADDLLLNNLPVLLILQLIPSHLITTIMSATNTPQNSLDGIQAYVSVNDYDARGDDGVKVTISFRSGNQSEEAQTMLTHVTEHARPIVGGVMALLENQYNPQHEQRDSTSPASSTARFNTFYLPWSGCVSLFRKPKVSAGSSEVDSPRQEGQQMSLPEAGAEDVAGYQADRAMTVGPTVGYGTFNAQRAQDRDVADSKSDGASDDAHEGSASYDKGKGPQTDSVTRSPKQLIETAIASALLSGQFTPCHDPSHRDNNSVDHTCSMTKSLGRSFRELGLRVFTESAVRDAEDKNAQNVAATSDEWKDRYQIKTVDRFDDTHESQKWAPAVGLALHNYVDAGWMTRDRAKSDLVSAIITAQGGGVSTEGTDAEDEDHETVNQAVCSLAAGWRDAAAVLKTGTVGDQSQFELSSGEGAGDYSDGKARTAPDFLKLGSGGHARRGPKEGHGSATYGGMTLGRGTF